MQINLPKNVRIIIEQLNSKGFEAYAVGGCVRDSLLGRTPNDWDITTSATPLEIKSVFRRTVDTGIKHGTVTVLLGKDSYEITTFRIDGEYSDHRRPDGVTFTRELSEDLMRRDFTINAMAYSDETGVVDLYGGTEDLENKVIRCVGNPDERFDEDALRIMRAVRFAAQLGFSIDDATRDAAERHALDLRNVSAERIETELTKLLVSAHPEKLLDMYEMGITAIVLPEFDKMVDTPQNTPYHKFDVGRHTIEVIKNVPATKVMRYAALLHDTGKPETRTSDESGRDHFKGHSFVSEKIAEKVLRRLRMDNDTIRDVKNIVLWHDYGIKGNISIKSVRKMLSQMGADYFDFFVQIRRADIKGQSDYNSKVSVETLEQIIRAYDKIIEDNNALTIGDLAITGKDLIEMGMKPGPEMGKTLRKLLELVLEDPALNDRDKLMEYVKAGAYIP